MDFADFLQFNKEKDSINRKVDVEEEEVKEKICFTNHKKLYRLFGFHRHSH
jgi:predicted TIM-barrel fold metal-dependent hydrolase